MKIFKFDWKTEIDWFVDENKEDARKNYSDFIGEYITEVPEPEELSESEAKSGYIIDIEDCIDDYFEDDIPSDMNEDDYHNGYRIVHSFYEAAQKATTPELIATTAF